MSGGARRHKSFMNSTIKRFLCLGVGSKDNNQTLQKQIVKTTKIIHEYHNTEPGKQTKLDTEQLIQIWWQLFSP
jgi:hypothetical protein